MKANVFFNNKPLTKVSINHKDEIPDLGAMIKIGNNHYYATAVDIIYSPDCAINITVDGVLFPELT